MYPREPGERKKKSGGGARKKREKKADNLGSGSDSDQPKRKRNKKVIWKLIKTKLTLSY